MRNVYIFTIIIFTYNFSAFCQNINEIKNQSTIYVWGEGTGKSIKQADNEALSMLIDQIQVQVRSNFEQQFTELNGKIDEKVKSIVKTYSNATLKNADRLIISNEPNAKVFRYIKRDEIAKIFESRKNKILEFVQSAQYSLDRVQIADALRYYYWAYILLRSHPDYNSMKYQNTNGKSELLSVYLPYQIRNVLNDIKIQLLNTNSNDNFTSYNLSIIYNKKPVTNFAYNFWDGSNYSFLNLAKDGIGNIEYPSKDIVDELKIKAEYAFEAESTIDFELHDALLAVEDDITFKEAYFNVNMKMRENLSPNQNLPKELKEPDSKDDYLNIMQMIVSAIKSKSYNLVEKLFTPEGFQMFQKLVAYGQAKILLTSTFNLMQYGDQVLCRSLKMSFNFPNNNRKFVEDVVFSFNKDKKIESLSFGLNQNTIQDILTPDKPWSDQLKVIIINFLENYQTAYALKRMDYIEKIFSDDAIIITGSVVKVKNSGEVKYKDNNIVRYNMQTKDQYIKNLRFCFNSNEFINLRFNESYIRKSARGDEVYGIQLKQDYFSSNYGDTGYLFLLVDLKSPDEPIIHVRTWQPEKNSDGSIYGIEDF